MVWERKEALPSRMCIGVIGIAATNASKMSKNIMSITKRYMGEKNEKPL